MTTQSGTFEQSNVAVGQAAAHSTNPARWVGLAAIVGALLMAAGGIIGAVSGAELDSALDDGTIAAYLVDASAESNLLVFNLSIWIVGVTMIAIAGAGFAGLGRQSHPATSAARTVFYSGAPLAAAAFVTWLALIRLAGVEYGSAEILPLADTIGWIASRADWVATVLLVGAGPGLLSLAGRDNWMPRWLSMFGAVAVATGVLTTVAMFTGGLPTYGILIVPIGLAWTVAAGVTAMRSA